MRKIFSVVLGTVLLVSVPIVASAHQANNSGMMNGNTNSMMQGNNNQNTGMTQKNQGNGKGMTNGNSSTNNNMMQNNMMNAKMALKGAFIKPLDHSNGGKYYEGESVFTASNPGTYYYICQVQDHASKGMYGKFIVK